MYHAKSRLRSKPKSQRKGRVSKWLKSYNKMKSSDNFSSRGKHTLQSDTFYISNPVLEPEGIEVR